MVIKKNNLWGTSDVCEYFGVTRQTVSNWVNKEGMPCYKVGAKTFKYDPELIKAWMYERSNLKVERSATVEEIANEMTRGYMKMINGVK